MRMYDIIEKKRNGEKLSSEEIEFFISGYVSGEIPDYQISALLMAIYFSGMDDEETAVLTKAMMLSGDTVDLSEFGEFTVDKHSTGGVGDKTSLVVAPVMASLGCKMAKMSGRGLGHTGGTVDKLESIPGFKTSITPEEFFEQVRKTGVAVIGSTANLAPADKKLYALRDVTATVGSIPLIASSIMSKKLAAGAHNIVLDVKIGSGAFMKTEEQGRKLAEKMVNIGKSFNRNIAAVITNMDSPLGCAIGNSLEVLEAVSVLKGNEVPDFDRVCVALASTLLSLCYDISHEESEKRVLESIKSGAALAKFREWITAQGGSDEFVDNPEALGTAKYITEYKAQGSGYISFMNTEMIGKAAAALGAGREKTTDSVDHTAGIVLRKKTGDAVRSGDVIAVLYTNKEASEIEAARLLSEAITYSAEKPAEESLVYGIIK